MNTPLILASSSKYRRELLSKLGIAFESITPICDEDAYKLKIKNPVELAKTLAQAKAESLASADNCVIGGDQVACIDGKILGKPKTPEKAFEQLKLLQAKTHQLITAVHVIHRKQHYPILDITELNMRALSDDEILAYIKKDNPLDCAASYKIEDSGICLMQKIVCQDFTAIQGLPMIALTNLLTKLNYNLF